MTSRSTPSSRRGAWATPHLFPIHSRDHIHLSVCLNPTSLNHSNLNNLWIRMGTRNRQSRPGPAAFTAVELSAWLASLQLQAQLCCDQGGQPPPCLVPRDCRVAITMNVGFGMRRACAARPPPLVALTLSSRTPENEVRRRVRLPTSVQLVSQPGLPSDICHYGGDYWLLFDEGNGKRVGGNVQDNRSYNEHERLQREDISDAET